MNNILYLPGFPGDRVKVAANEVRLSKIVSDVCRSKQFKFFKHQYPGIVDDNSFSFQKSINSVDEKAYDLLNMHTIIGHSWGAGVLINYLAQQKIVIPKIILITPFIILPDKTKLIDMIDIFSNLYPDLIPENKRWFFVQELLEIKNRNLELLSLGILSKYSKEIMLFYAEKDEFVSLSDINKIKRFCCNLVAEYSLNTTHNFIGISEQELLKLVTMLLA